MMSRAADLPLDELRYPDHGAQLFPGVLGQVDVDAVLASVAHLPRDRAGIRLVGISGLSQLLGPRGSVGAIAASVIGPAARPVRALLFDKSAGNNWSLGWHQDRTVVVKERREVDGYGSWSTKSGLQHVAPPFDVLESMVTLRVHLDPVGSKNAPLLIAPGSGQLGLVPATEAAETAARCGVVACLAEPGDIWLYATPILHASDAASVTSRRRVLQVDYAAQELEGGLEWLGIG